jgi:hypothetical protein
MSATNYIIFAGGNATGVGFTPDGTLPSGATACTTGQAAAWQFSTLVSGAIVAGSAPAPGLTQQAAGLLAGGLAITSTATTALSATYPVDPVSQQKLLAVQSVLSVTGSFPGGASTWPVKDAAGAWHVCTAAQFTAIAVAIAAFVAPCDLIMDGHTGISLPATSATIA